MLATGVPAAADDGPVEAGIVVDKVENLPADFVNGVDVSSVLSLEDSGVVFRDSDGVEADLFTLLADAGVTDVRVRVWNDPFTAAGDGYGGGDVDVDRAVEIGERATVAGLRLLVDFHYSDFWADPAKQHAPKAWADYDVAQTAAAVGEFTTDALERFAAAGVDVRMVQIGNETNNGVAGVTGWPAMTQVFSAGAAAVRSVLPDALVAVHFTNPESAGRYAGYAAQLDAAGVDYDVFASSYYPFWHGTTANLTAVLRQVADTYGKQVMVAETSWARTLDDADGHGNVIDLASEATAYPVSVQGQATAVRDVIQAVADVGDAALGVFYWEPAWLPVGPPSALEANKVLWERDGSGWASSFAGEYDPDDAGQWYGGSAWDNQALFAADGTALESLNVFAYARTGAVAPRAVTDVETVTATFTEGEPIELPATVAVSYNDGSVEQQAVTWSDALDWIDGAGSYAVSGITADGHATSAQLTVAPHELLIEGGFEGGDLSAWTSSGPPLRLGAADDPHSGVASAHFYSASAFTFTLTQTVEAPTAGDYRATAALQGDGEGDSGEVSIRLANAAGGSADADFALDGWRVWSTPSTAPVEAQAGDVLTVTISATLPAEAWGTLDDVSLALAAAPGADTSELEAVVAQAGAITRSAYSAASLARLDAAVEIARVVLGAASPSAERVADATTLVRDAIDGLEVVGETPDPTVTPVALTVVDGDPVVLPAEVTLVEFDGSTRTESVTWQPLPVILGPGAFEVDGVTASGLAATASVTVVAREFLVNGGFEASDPAPWTITGSGLTIGASENPAEGTRAANFWLDTAYTATLEQRVTGLPRGRYTVAATTQGDGEEAGDTVTLSAIAATASADAGLALDGWRVFDTATTAPVAVGPDGVLTVRVALSLSAGAWGTIDDLRLVRVDEGARSAPARAVLSHDNGWDTGLHDGAYTVRMNLWWGENAVAFRLFENGELVATVPLSYGGVGGQAASVPITGRVDGSYVYTGELVNSRGTTATAPVTVVVRDAAPGKPVLSHDDWDRDGDFTLTANLWWGTNADAYAFYADDELVAEGALSAATPRAQRATLAVADAAPGAHVYRVEFRNAAGSTWSAPLTVSAR